MTHNVFRGGMVHVMKAMCSTCIYRPGNLMKLQEGVVEEMTADAIKNESTIVCHQTLDGDNAACHGFFDRHATAPLQIADRLGYIEWVS